MIGTVVLLAMAAPAAAQDVVYRFEQRVDAPLGAGAAGQGDVFTLAVPPGGAGGLIEQRMGLLAVEPFDALDDQMA